MALHETAMYLMVESLASALSTRAGDWLGNNVANPILETYPKLPKFDRWTNSTPSLHNLVPKPLVRPLLQAIDYAFFQGNQSQPLQDVFVDFAAKTNFWILHDKDFNQEMSSTPKYASCIMNRILRSELGSVFSMAPRSPFPRHPDPETGDPGLEIGFADVVDTLNDYLNDANYRFIHVEKFGWEPTWMTAPAGRAIHMRSGEHRAGD